MGPSIGTVAAGRSGISYSDCAGAAAEFDSFYAATASRILHHLADLPVEQVAEETGSSVSAVKKRLARGRAALALLLADQPDANGAATGVGDSSDPGVETLAVKTLAAGKEGQ